MVSKDKDLEGFIVQKTGVFYLIYLVRVHLQDNYATEVK